MIFPSFIAKYDVACTNVFAGITDVICGFVIQHRMGKDIATEDEYFNEIDLPDQQKMILSGINFVYSISLCVYNNAGETY